MKPYEKRKLLFDTFFEEFCKRTGIKEHKDLFVEIAKQKLAKSSIFYHADDIELQMTSQEAIIEDALKAIDRILGKKDDKSDALKPYQDTFEE